MSGLSLLITLHCSTNAKWMIVHLVYPCSSAEVCCGTRFICSMQILRATNLPHERLCHGYLVVYYTCHNHQWSLMIPFTVLSESVPRRRLVLSTNSEWLLNVWMSPQTYLLPYLCLFIKSFTLSLPLHQELFLNLCLFIVPVILAMHILGVACWAAHPRHSHPPSGMMVSPHPIKSLLCLVISWVISLLRFSPVVGLLLYMFFSTVCSPHL